MTILSNVELNGATVICGVLGLLTMLVSGLLLTNNEASFVQNDIEKRLFSDNAFLVRAIGHECFLVGTMAWCSVVNGHSRVLARWWAVGVIPSIWNKAISGDQAGATTNAIIGLMCLGFGYRTAASKASAILFGVIGSLALLVSLPLLTNNEESLLKNDLERRLLKDNAFLVRGVGHELAVLSAVIWCSVFHGHTAAVARWWAVGLIPSIWNKAISGDEGGAMMNAIVGLVCLCVGCRASGFTRKAELAANAAKLA